MKRVLVPALALVATLALGAADWYVDPGVRLFPLYFVPVGLATWLQGRTSGVIFALLAIVVWESANHFDGHAPGKPLVEIWNAGVQLGSLLAFSLLLASLREKFNREHERSRLDALTGIWNTLGLHERAALEIARARDQARPIALAYIDLDGFKAVNDAFGHEVGNSVLARVATILQRTCRSSDTCARVGGDEFVVLLPGIDAQAATQVLARVVSNIADAMRSEGWPVTASAGCACFETAPSSVHTLLARADSLMYRSKREGKNRAVVERVERTALVLAT